jgi:Purine-cytosine permease and related proteins
MRDSVAQNTLAARAEDHALVSVPIAERKSGYHLSMSTVGIATALAIFAIGGFTVVLAGFKMGILAGAVSGLLGFILGKLLAQIAFRTGMSSTLTSRFYGLGFKGSALGSFIFSFLVLGFLALENALLYEGTLLMFDLHDTLLMRITLYGGMTLLWITLAIFGIKLALRSSFFLTIVTVLITLFMIYQIFVTNGISPTQVLAFPGIIPGGAWQHFDAALALIGGTAGTIALVSADFGRYSRSSKDVTILAALGPLVQNLLTLIMGALIVIGSLPQIVQYLLLKHPELSPQTAATAAQHFAMSNTGAYYVILAGTAGFITIYAAQAKAQAINAYSGSLALVNLVDSLFNIKPGRAAMVVLGNGIALLMIAAGILDQFAAWIAWLGCMTMSLCGVMIADYYLVRGRIAPVQVENCNWAGMITLVVTSLVGIVLIASQIFPCGFLISLVMTFILYPLLRKWLPDGTATRYIAEQTVLEEAL